MAVFQFVGYLFASIHLLNSFVNGSASDDTAFCKIVTRILEKPDEVLESRLLIKLETSFTFVWLKLNWLTGGLNFADWKDSLIYLIQSNSDTLSTNDYYGQRTIFFKLQYFIFLLNEFWGEKN